MNKVLNLPTIFLSVSFVSALVAVGHAGMVVSKSILFVIILSVVLGAIYSLQLYRLTKDFSPKSVFISSLLFVIGGLTSLLAWVISSYHFRDRFPNYTGGQNADFGIIIFLSLMYIVVPLVIIYSIFAIWLPIGLASEKSEGKNSGRTRSIFHGAFWGLFLVAFCVVLSFPTYLLLGSDIHDILRGIRVFIIIDVIICVIAFGGFWLSSFKGY